MAVRLLEFNILTITIIKKKVTKYKKKTDNGLHTKREPHNCC